MFKIIAIGDSITHGFPFTPLDSWVELAARELNISIINRGVCGDLTGDMLKRFPQAVLAASPTHVIITGGTNDAFARLPLTTVADKLEAMVTVCRKNGIIPLFGLPIPILFPLDEAILCDYRDWLESYARSEHLMVIDFYSAFYNEFRLQTHKNLFSDGVHPSLMGYRLMAETAVEILKTLI